MGEPEPADAGLKLFIDGCHLPEVGELGQDVASDVQAGSDYADALTASFNALPAVNFGALLAMIVICSPVDGLRPVRSARLATVKLPNPISCTGSPRARARVRFSSAESSARPASPCCG